MNSKLYRICLDKYEGRNTEDSWQMLADKYDYSNGEALRSAFRREKANRGYINYTGRDVKSKQFSKDKDFPKILIFDIETTPMIVYSWGLYDQKILPENVLVDWHCLSWSAKYLFDNEIYSGVLTPDEVIQYNDERILKEIWKLLDDSDIVVTHNGNRFDIPKLNTRFLFWGMLPPNPSKTIDTYQTARTVFGFSSNRLDYINRYLGLDGKTDTEGFELWRRCMDGEQEALDKMVKYNKNDVVISEELYLILRPWIKRHPKLGLYTESAEPVCPYCGSSNLHWKGSYYTPLGKYDSFRCDDCGGIGRSKENKLSLTKRKNMAV